MDRYSHLIGEVRRLLAALASARLPDDVAAEVAVFLADISETLQPFAVTEDNQVFGQRHDLVGRGQVLAPAVAYEYGQGSVIGRASFSRYYLGSNGAAHGGAIALLFDEVFGQLAGSIETTRSRTAFLRVEYRAITPIGVPIHVEARSVRREGRKMYIEGVLTVDGSVTADASALLVTLAPHQP